MSFRRMTRMVSFRISNDEFEELRNKSEAYGARSVSDYARLLLCGGGAMEQDQSEDLQQLSERIQRLTVDVRRLTTLLERPQSQRNDSRSEASNLNNEQMAESA
jgi:hypothetical protein